MNNEHEKKDLIMAVISNYTWEDVKPFFLSLEKSEFAGEVVLFIENINEQTQKILKDLKLDMNLIPFQRVRLENIFNICDYRHYLYLNFLESMSHCYNNVLLTDVRDVYFQMNPFHAHWSEDCITVAKEPKMINDELWNTRWILNKFGYHIYAQLKDNIAICAGTTYGPASQILNYLKDMVFHLFYNINYLPSMINDQAVHNYLVHTGKIKPISFSDNFNGPIMTLNLESKTKIKINNERKQVLLKNGTVAPILHQYDRHPKIVNLIRNLCN